MEKINKKGSHVSMILSFILFVVSLIFIYLIASSSILPSEKVKNEVSNLERNIVKTLSSEIWVLRVNEEGMSDACFSMTKPEDISNAETIALDDSGGINSSTSGNQILIDGGKNFVKVYFSDLIQNQNTLLTTGCTQISPNSTIKEKVISESQILNLMSNFSSNYSSLKEQLGVPTSMDFDLYFEYKNETTVGELKSDPSTEVYSKEINLFFVSNKAVNDEGKLRIKIW
ncbi:hypothetical protein GW931_03640 [archaeon]|nr:hypothetical protein [archaeon]PJC45666.1 MAG: hypothetical protein CO037_00270 [Candidatus Pacearchaeota archaeon CG_4_9_14_0_2_um_filter_30_8]